MVSLVRLVPFIVNDWIGAVLIQTLPKSKLVGLTLKVACPLDLTGNPKIIKITK